MEENLPKLHLNSSTSDILGWTIRCCRGLACTLEDGGHLWLLPPCRDRPSLRLVTKMCPDTANCPLGGQVPPTGPLPPLRTTDLNNYSNSLREMGLCVIPPPLFFCIF